MSDWKDIAERVGDTKRLWIERAIYEVAAAVVVVVSVSVLEWRM